MFDSIFPDQLKTYREQPVASKIFADYIPINSVRTPKRMKLKQASWNSILFSLGSVKLHKSKYYFTCTKCHSVIPYEFAEISGHLSLCNSSNDAKLFISNHPVSCKQSRPKMSVLITQDDLSIKNSKPRLKIKRSSSCDESIISNYYTKGINMVNPRQRTRSRKSLFFTNLKKNPSTAVKYPSPVEMSQPVLYFDGFLDKFGFFPSNHEFVCFKCKSNLHSRLPRVFLVHLLSCLTDALQKTDLILKYDARYPNMIEDIVTRFDEKCLVRSLSDVSYLELLEFIKKVKAVGHQVDQNENTPPAPTSRK
eukprot:NODE_241_length_13209_cov_0.424256.p3 type:complete len:308 gc:universal NODE_241_length_13209_cov_0.424256:10844-11767(+)